MKVLLATNMDDLDEAIASEAGIEVVCNPVQYREDVIRIAEETEPDVIVITPWLEGNMDIIDVVYQLRSLDIRVVFIAGSLTQDDLTVKRILELGVYDILFGEIRIGQVLDKIFNPTPLSQEPSLKDIDKSGHTDQKTTENALLNHDKEDYSEEERESALSKLVKIGGGIRKNIPSIAVPKLTKRAHNARRLEKLIAVCSPVQAGKTFVSTNLATIIALEGYATALVDIDYKKFSIHTWLNCPGGEDGLYQALNDNSDPMEYAYQPDYIPGLYVFTNDPGEEALLISDKNLVSLLESIQNYVDVIILDTPGDFNAPVVRTAINISSTLMIVSDPDFSHLLSIQKVIDNLPDDFDFEKCVVIANQLIDSEKLPVDDAEKATGMKVSCVISSNPRSVLESIKVGIPAVMFDQEIKKAFQDLVYRELAQAG